MGGMPQSPFLFSAAHADYALASFIQIEQIAQGRAPIGSIDSEVAPIQGQHVEHAEFLREPDQRGVRLVYRGDL